MSEAAAVRSWWSPIAAYLTPRMLIILAMGFASGLPLLLTLSTLSYWLSKVGVDKTTIGLFALVGTPYTFKFLWSPINDQVRLPILAPLLGRRRSWLLLTQILLAIAIFLMGLTDPAVDPAKTAIMALIIAFLSASQDIVIDAYRIEILPEEEQGQGAAATQTGYRFGNMRCSLPSWRRGGLGSPQAAAGLPIIRTGSPSGRQPRFWQFQDYCYCFG